MNIKELRYLGMFDSADTVAKAISDLVDFDDGYYEVMTERNNSGQTVVRQRPDEPEIGPCMDSNLAICSVVVNKCGNELRTKIGACKHYVWVHVSKDTITLSPDDLKSENLWEPDRSSQLVRIIGESPREITTKGDLVFNRDPD